MGSAVYPNRETVVLQALGFVVKQRVPVGPPQDITWSTGTDPQGRTPLQASREDYETLSHIESHRERVYAAMIRSLDRGVGQVLDALKANGLEGLPVRKWYPRALLRQMAQHNAAQAEPSWPSQASVPINIDKNLSQPDAPDDEYIYWSN